MANRKGGCGGVIFGLIFSVVGTVTLIFMLNVGPNRSEYEEVMTNGEALPGVITAITADTSMTINNDHPEKISFDYGDSQSGQMTIAMKESVQVGREITIRKLGDQAYPEGIKPLWMPFLFLLIPVVFLLIGGIALVASAVKVLLVGFLLARGG